MARLQTKYTCSNCGYETTKWLGKCPECEAWDSFVEEVTVKEKSPLPGKGSGGGFGGSGLGGGSGLSGGNGGRGIVAGSGAPVPITSVTVANTPRISSGIGEFDRVLGGGIVPGGLMLVGGEPGVGKTTLANQVAAKVSNDPARSVLYISGEESAQQIKMRTQRLGAENERFFVGVETEIGVILHHLDSLRPALAVIDSIQTMSDSGMESAPGTVSQVRQCATHLARFAKSTGVPIILIGHVTKEGNLAGPRVLEHLVDTVLYFEGDRHHAYRLLRAAKNRFGSTDELGIFEMHETGLVGVENPSAILLSERDAGGTGSAVASTLEGSRALLVEVQALVARSNLASPRRVVTGMDPNRVNMILAVLEKRVGLKLAEQDAYINVAGGIRIVEPASDLATACAIASNFREQAVDPSAIVLGEIGLAGEVRAVSQIEKRLREAARQGFSKAIISKHNTGKLPKIPDMKVIGVAGVHDALHAALLPAPRGE